MINKNEDYLPLFEEVLNENFMSNRLTKRLEKNEYKSEDQRNKDKEILDKYLTGNYSALGHLKAKSQGAAHSILSSIAGSSIGLALISVFGSNFFNTENIKDQKKWDFFVKSTYNDPSIRTNALKIDSLIKLDHYSGREEEIKKLYEKIQIDLKYKIKELKLLWKYSENNGREE